MSPRLAELLLLWHKWRHAVWNARDWYAEAVIQGADHVGIKRGWWWVKLRARRSYGAALSEYHRDRAKGLERYLASLLPPCPDPFDEAFRKMRRRDL